MKHIFASSSLSVSGNPENQPTQEELSLPDGISIAELLLNETETEIRTIYYYFQRFRDSSTEITL